MFSGPKTNPFSFYPMNRVEKSEDNYYLRTHENELWVATLIDGKLTNAIRKIYQPRKPMGLSGMRAQQSPNYKPIIERQLTSEQQSNFLDAINLFKTKQEKDNRKLLELTSTKKTTDVIDFKPTEACFVLQHEYAITVGKAKKPILGSIGAGPCLILILHNNEKTFLGHIDMGTDLTSLANTIHIMQDQDTVAYLAGGTLNTIEMCADVVSLLQENQIHIAYADLIHNTDNPSSLAINSKTGALYSPVDETCFDKADDMALRLMKTSTQQQLSPLHQCYDGMKDLKFSFGK